MLSRSLWQHAAVCTLMHAAGAHCPALVTSRYMRNPVSGRHCRAPARYTTHAYTDTVTHAWAQLIISHGLRCHRRVYHVLLGSTCQKAQALFMRKSVHQYVGNRVSISAFLPILRSTLYACKPYCCMLMGVQVAHVIWQWC